MDFWRQELIEVSYLFNQQVAHPITSEFITRYPAWQPEEVSEVWHARRWYEFGFEMLNPLWISPETGKQFFVREVTRMKNGELVYPLVWVTLPHGNVGAFSSRVVEHVSNSSGIYGS